MSVGVVCGKQIVNNKDVKMSGFTSSHTQTQYHRD